MKPPPVDVSTTCPGCGEHIPLSLDVAFAPGARHEASVEMNISVSPVSVAPLQETIEAHLASAHVSP